MPSPSLRHRSEQAAHLGECGTAGLLDAPERVPVLVEGLRELVPDCADLEHHHAHGVGDDVVQLARDPRALLGHGDPRGGFALPLGEGRPHLRRLSLPLGERRAHLRRLGLCLPFPQGIAGDPGDDEPERDEDEVAGRLCAGDVRHHDDDASEHDREADPRLPVVAQVSEQERGCQPNDAEAADERDQQSVGVRERGGDEPVGRGSGEGKAATHSRRQDETRHRRYGEPQAHRRGAWVVAPDHEFKHPGDRHDRDQQFEPVLARDVPNPAHVLKVLQALACRLRPK
jgi:hypothetical protein